jgi:hypothetical protein
VDQALLVQVAGSSSEVVVLVEPVFEGAQPRFALAGWSCPLRLGKQYLALPVATGTQTIELRLTGTPNREGEYLIVYTPAVQEPRGDVVRCS